MTDASQGINWKGRAFCGLAVISCLAAGGYFVSRNSASAEAEQKSPGDEGEPAAADVHVEFVYPQKGRLPRVTRQPGTVVSFDSARIFAEVSGYLKEEKVDIGSRVKTGDVLIKIDVPDLEKLRDKWAAAVLQANAHVKQAESRLDSANADLKTAQAKLVQAEASAKSAHAWRVFRDKQLRRYQELFALKSVDERLVDEAQDQAEAAAETERAARAGVKSAEAAEEAARAKIKQAEADIASAKADVKVAEAELAAAEVKVGFATITSPYDGYITQRSMWPGDFVRAASEGSTPLLTVERTDKMRVIVQIPDRDVPYCDPGDPATIEIDALPAPIKAQVTRIARSEDPQTKLMRAEIDVDNKDGKLRQGMYGWVTILLDRESDQLSIPSCCLVGKARDGKGSVYVVREGRARLVTIKYGIDNGHLTAVLSGLTAKDQVISQAPPSLHDGDIVTAVPSKEFDHSDR
jgi:RND family efflux transporter MFP subunit